LFEYLHYDPATGIFTGRLRGRGMRNYGKPLGAVSPAGYRIIMVDGVLYQASHLAWFYVHGEWPANIMDHRDLDKANDRIENLRPATRSQNQGNQRARSNNSSGRKGVSRSVCGKRWQVSIAREHIGIFDTIEEAADAYRIAAIAKFGEFARFD